MGNHVQGKRVEVFLDISGTYYPIFCGKTMSFSLEQDELETTSVNSGAYREYIAGMANATLEVGGVTIIDNTSSRIAITYLQTKSVQRALHNWKIKLTADNGTIKYYLFSGIIRSTSFDKTIPASA